MRAYMSLMVLVGCQSTGPAPRKVPTLADQKCNSTGCLGNPNYQPNPVYDPRVPAQGSQKQPGQSSPYEGPSQAGSTGSMGNGSYPGYVPYYGSQQIVGNFWIPGYGVPGFPNSQSHFPSKSSVPGYGKPETPSSSNPAPPTKENSTIPNPQPPPQPPPPAYGACAPEVLARNQTVSVGGSQFSQTATASSMTGTSSAISKFTNKYVVLSNGRAYSVNSITSPVFRDGRSTSNVTPVNYDANSVAYMTVDGMNIPWGVVYLSSDGKARMDLINGACVVQYGSFNGGIPVLVVP